MTHLEQWRSRSVGLLQAVDHEEEASIVAAARDIADSLRAGGVVQAFGTGHSRSVALEIVGRAGGLVASNQLGIRDLAYYGTTPLVELLDPKTERKPGLAKQILDLAELDPADIFVIISNSGRNAAIVEMAQEAAARGHRVIAITSRPISGKVDPTLVNHLARLADHVVYTHTCEGDACVETPLGRACGTSTLCGVYIAQCLLAAVIDDLSGTGDRTGVLTSANWPGGDDANAAMTAPYGGRVRWGDA